MTFQREAPNEHYRQLRLVEVQGGWELGLSLYATGMRLRMGRSGRPPSVMDFCLGMDPALYAPVLTAAVARLEKLPAAATASEIDAQFPWKGTRPNLAIHLDDLFAGSSEITATVL